MTIRLFCCSLKVSRKIFIFLKSGTVTFVTNKHFLHIIKSTAVMDVRRFLQNKKIADCFQVQVRYSALRGVACVYRCSCWKSICRWLKWQCLIRFYCEQVVLSVCYVPILPHCTHPSAIICYYWIILTLLIDLNLYYRLFVVPCKSGRCFLIRAKTCPCCAILVKEKWSREKM